MISGSLQEEFVLVRTRRACRGLRARHVEREALRTWETLMLPRESGVVRPNKKKAERRARGSQIAPQYSEGGRAGHMGKGATVLRSPQRKHDAEERAC